MVFKRTNSSFAFALRVDGVFPELAPRRLGKTAWNPVVHGKWPHNTLKSGKACTVFILTKATPDGGKSVLLSKRFALKASGK